jgi:hypothetical protein
MKRNWQQRSPRPVWSAEPRLLPQASNAVSPAPNSPFAEERTADGRYAFPSPPDEILKLNSPLYLVHPVERRRLARDPPKVGRRHPKVGGIHLRAIRQVDGIAAQLQLHAFAELELANQISKFDYIRSTSIKAERAAGC